MSITWFNGNISESTIALDPLDRGLTLGDGIFETVLVQSGKPVWLVEHLNRFKRSAEELGIGFEQSRVEAGVAEVLAKNQNPRAVLRLTLTRGIVQPRALSGHGEHPNLLMSVLPLGIDQSLSINLATSTIRRNETAPSSRLKTLSYIDNIAAAREITARADDALMLTTAGNVACTSIGNLFLLRGNELITPRLDQAILPGITRAKLLGLAPELGLQPVEKIVSAGELKTADAVFRTNSLRLMTEITTLDGQTLGTRSISFIRQSLNNLTHN